MDYEGFKRDIYVLSGINLSCYKEKQMKRRIDALIKKNGYELYEHYIKAIKDDKILYNEFINYMTINVSEFFRNPEQWTTLETSIFPMLLNKSKTLKIWSSACSTGDEPYTLTMVLNKFLPLSSIRIIATDIDKEAIQKARDGVYNSRTIANVPQIYLEKYFTKMGDVYKVKDEVKRCVEFRQHNLLQDQYPSGCDLIVCRNVLIYFTEEAKNEIYKKFNKSLKKNGTLFVGSTEQIILASKFNFKPLKTFFYTKEDDLAI
jgi:chemotaxis protein methyltransferase CheR